MNKTNGEIKEQDFKVLEFSGYATDGDYKLVIRHLQKEIPDTIIRKGSQSTEYCTLTIDQILKIYGYLEGQEERRASVKKKTETPYHFSDDDNIVLLCHKGELSLSELPTYENEELRAALMEKYGRYEAKYKNKDDHERRGEILSFDEYFEGYGFFDKGGKLDQQILIEAKKVYEKYKTPKAISKFYANELNPISDKIVAISTESLTPIEDISRYIKSFGQKTVDIEKLQKLINDGGSFYDTTVFACICNEAGNYAKYVKEHKPKSKTTKLSKVARLFIDKNFLHKD